MAAEPELLKGNRAASLAKGSEALRLPGQTGDHVDPEGNSLGSARKLQQPHSYNRFLQLKELC